MIEDYLWCERFRPHTVANCILPASLKTQFQKYVDDKQIPNLILAGSSGLGKTSVARAMIDESDAEYYMINASLHGNIDTLRNEIMQFASSVSMKGGRKYVLLDEADKTSSAFQEGLRAFIEEFSKVTGFILTCNHKSRLIPALHSRCPVVEFKVQKADMKDVITQLLRRLTMILTTEKVPFENTVLLEVIKKWFPDNRRIIGELQRYAQGTGKIDAGILTNFTEARLQTLVDAMQKKDFTSVRKWVTENSDIDSAELFRKFYDVSSPLLTTESIPASVVILARYQYQSAFVADQEINVAACLAELMTEIVWKK